MKRILKSIAAFVLCICLVAAVCPMTFAESAPNYRLQFGSDGKFKIVVFADCQDDASPDSRMISLMTAALAFEQPDLVVFPGDNVVVSTMSSFETGAEKLLAPLVARGIPYAYTFGNHDDQASLVTKEKMHNIYKSIGTCLTYDAAPDITGFGNCNLPIYSSDGTDIAFNLWMIDSNTYDSDDNYDYVHQDQLNWYTSTSQALEAQAGHKVNSLMFQHIIVPEAYNLLTENSSGSKTYNGKKYSLNLNSNATGYLGEFPCPPVTNGGELATVAARGDVLGIVTGHDHSNGFIGTVNGVDLIQVQGITFESYGDDNIRGYRSITIDEDDTSTYETEDYTYNQFIAGELEPEVTLDPTITEYYYAPNTLFISELAASANSNKTTAKNALTNNGFTVIDKDLNADAGGDYVYIGYKTSTNYADSIKAVRFRNLGSSNTATPAVSPVNGNNCSFSIVNHSSLGIVDLNKGASGNYIYTYFTRDIGAGPAITSLYFNNSDTGGTTCTSFSASTTASDLNAGAKGEYIYGHYSSSLVAVDSSALRTALTSANGYIQAAYTADSWSQLQSALTAGQTIINILDTVTASTYSQTDINNAAVAITNAISNLAHTVTYKNYDGSVITTESVVHGNAAKYSGTPLRPSDAQYNYTFSGWDKSLTAINAHTTVTAQYASSIRSYTIKFQNYDHTDLQSIDIAYGTTPVYTGSTPTKAATSFATYTFAGWSPAIEPVTGAATYIATFTENPIEYNISFLNYDSTVLQSSLWAYGTTPTYSGATPTKPSTAQYSYSFLGWTPSIVPVSEAAIYIAQYTSAVNNYTVTFKNYDGSVLQTLTLAYGAVPAYTNPTPVKPATAQYSYTFIGWSSAIVSVTGNAEYTAQYASSARKYIITFANYNGTALQTSNVTYGDTPSYTGATPVKPSDMQYTYTFTGWSSEISPVSGEQTYTATFSETAVQYTIKFMNSSTVLQSSMWGYGTTPVYSGATPTKASTSQYTYTFSGWSPEISQVTEAATYVATFTQSPVEYTVTFKNYNGTVLESAQWQYNAVPSYSGATPVKPSTKQYSYTFAGWSPSILKVTKDITYYAQYDSTLNQYTVNFENYDGTLLQTSDWDYNVTPEYTGSTPVKPANAQFSYVFSGWSPAITAVKDTITYTAQFTETTNKYSITFLNFNGTTLQTSDWDYGTTPIYSGDEPVKAATTQFTYSFSGWSPTISSVTGSAIYIAQFTETANQGTFTFYIDNVLINSLTITQNTGTPVTAPVYAAPEGYSFSGWSPAVPATMTAGTTAFYGTTELLRRTYTFYIDNALMESMTITQDYGTAVTAPVYLPPEGYTFSGWSPAVPATMGATDTAFFGTTAPKSVTLTFYVDGAIRNDLTVTANYGTAVTAPTVTKLNYTFSGWSPEVPASMPANDTAYYGTFKADTSTVTFNLNGGTGTVPAAVTDVIGAAVTLPVQGDIAREGYDFLGWNTDLAATVALESYAIGATDAVLYAVWSEAVAIELVPEEGSTTVIDKTNGFIYGITEGLSKTSFTNNFLAVHGEGRVECLTSGNRIGTGTVVNFYNDKTNELIESFIVVVFGDLDGNGLVNSRDISAANSGLVEGFEEEYIRTAANISILRRNDTFNARDLALLVEASMNEGINQEEIAVSRQYYGM